MPQYKSLCANPIIFNWLGFRELCACDCNRFSIPLPSPLPFDRLISLRVRPGAFMHFPSGSNSNLSAPSDPDTVTADAATCILRVVVEHPTARERRPLPCQTIQIAHFGVTARRQHKWIQYSSAGVACDAAHFSPSPTFVRARRDCITPRITK